MDTLRQQVQALTPGDWQTFLAWIVTTETDRRAAQPAVEEARAEDTQKLWEAHPELKPAFKTEEDIPQSGDALTLDELLAQCDQWVQPSGAHDALPTGAIVAHEGAIWRTDLPTLNVWEPGTMNTQWVDITDQLLAESRKAQPRSRNPRNHLPPRSSNPAEGMTATSRVTASLTTAKSTNPPSTATSGHQTHTRKAGEKSPSGG